MEWLIFWLILAIIPAVAASSRGRSGPAWFLLGLLISPLLALILVLVLPNQSMPPASAATTPSGESVERRAHAIGVDLPVVQTYRDVDDSGLNPGVPVMYSNGDIEASVYNASSSTYDAVELDISLWGVPVRGLRPSLVRRAGVGSLLVFDRPEPFHVATKTIVLRNVKPGAYKFKTKAPGRLPPNPVAVPVVKRILLNGEWSGGTPVNVESMRRALTQPAAPEIPIKKCPDCGEDVRLDARICRFCRYQFGPSAQA